MKNSSDTIGKRTRDLPTCSLVPQPTALRRAPCRPVQHFNVISREPKRVLSTRFGLHVPSSGTSFYSNLKTQANLSMNNPVRGAGRHLFRSHK